MSNKDYQDPSKQPWVPVISSTGKPLMPCSPKRARELLRKGKATKKWSRGTIMYLQLVDREDGDTQDISLGIDPGSKREGYCVITTKRVLLNIQSHAIDGKWIKKKVEMRTMMRRSRRSRKTPCRTPRFSNRSRKGYLPPSTKARWQLKLNIVKWLMRLYPINYLAIEDVGTTLKKDEYIRNNSFSPIMVGKNWLYSRLETLFPDSFKKLPGRYTHDVRKQLGIYKNSNKLDTCWHTHCVDAWVVAMGWFESYRNHTIHKKVIELIPRKLYRRQLHRLTFQRGGKRSRYGGTMSSGYKKGTFVTHVRYGIVVLGPTLKRGITLYGSSVGSVRVTMTAKISDILAKFYSPWSLKIL